MGLYAGFGFIREFGYFCHLKKGNRYWIQIIIKNFNTKMK